MKRALAYTTVVLIASAFVAKIARADILFVDLNDSPEEIAAAQKAAKIRGEKLVIFPERTPEQQKLLDRMHELEIEKTHVSGKAIAGYRKLDEARTELNRLLKSGRSPNDPEILKLQNEEQAGEQEMEDGFASVQPQIDKIDEKEAKLNTGVSVDTSKLQALVDSYDKPGKKLETIIISGHHDYNEYTGAIGSIVDTDVVNAFKNDPNVYNNVKSLYGWDCYSATPAEQDYWGRMFPHLELLGGFDAGAPAATRPADAEFLEGLLVKEAEIRKLGDDTKTAHDAQLISRVAHAIPGWDMANTALCTRSVCVGLNTGALDLSKQTAICTQKQLDQLTTDTLRYTAVMAAETPGCENAPCDGQHSWLRSYYNNLRSHQHCGTEPNMLQQQYADLTQNADIVIRTIDFGEIYNNFNTYYKGDIARLQRVEQSCKMTGLPDVSGEVTCTPPPAQDPRAHTQTRAQIATFIGQLADESQKCIQSKTLNPGDTAFLALINAKYIGVVYNLQCIPLNWVNPPVGGKRPDTPDPACMDQLNSYANGLFGQNSQPQNTQGAGGN